MIIASHTLSSLGESPNDVFREPTGEEILDGKSQFPNADISSYSGREGMRYLM